MSLYTHKWMKFLCVALLLATELASAALYRNHWTNDRQYRRDLRATVNFYSDQSHTDLLPFFDRAKMVYPPKEIALLVFKDEKVMELWASDGKRWAFITDFDVLAASGAPGPKLHSGDNQVPEGIYHIAVLNPYSKYDLSLMINYPDAFDKVHAKLDHRQDLGGNIFIHGGNLSRGCVAIGNHNIEDLFVLVYEVGAQNVSVIIAPNDLREEPPILAGNSPVWINELNYSLKEALKRFPLQNI